jgi:hypothetical protein
MKTYAFLFIFGVRSLCRAASSTGATTTPLSTLTTAASVVTSTGSLNRLEITLDGTPTTLTQASSFKPTCGFSLRDGPIGFRSKGGTSRTDTERLPFDPTILT